MIRYMVFNKDIYDSYVEDNINNKYANNIINKQLIYFNPFSIVEDNQESIVINSEMNGFEMQNIILEKDTIYEKKLDTVEAIGNMCINDKKEIFKKSAILTLGIYNCHFNNIVDEIIDQRIVDNLKDLKSKKLKLLEENFPLSFNGEKKKKNKVTKFIINKAGSEIFKYIAEKDNGLFSIIKSDNININNDDDYKNIVKIFKIENSYFKILKGLYNKILDISDYEGKVNHIYNKYNEIYLAEMIFGFYFSKQVYDFMEDISLEDSEKHNENSTFKRYESRKVIIDLAKTIMTIKSPMVRMEVFRLIKSEIEFIKIDDRGSRILTNNSKKFIMEIQQVLKTELIKFINDVFDFRVFELFCDYKKEHKEKYNEFIAQSSQEIGERINISLPIKPEIKGFDYVFNAIQTQVFQAYRQQYTAINEREFEQNVRKYIKKFENESLFEKYMNGPDWVTV